MNINLSIVRLAEPEDEHDLMLMCREAHDESPLRNAQGRALFFSDAKARATIRGALYKEQGRASWVGIIGERGSLQGSVCLSIIEPSTFSHEQFLSATWNFVRREYRGTGNSRTLLSFSQKVSDTLGIPLFLEEREWHKGKKTLYERALKRQPSIGVFLYNSLTDSAGAGA